MDSVSTALAVVAGSIIVLGAIIGVVIFIRGSYGKARLEALREDNDDFRKRVADLDRDLEVLTEKYEVKKTENESLKGENGLLRELSLQRADVTGVKEMLEAHDQRVASMYKRMMDKLDKWEQDHAARG